MRRRFLRDRRGAAAIEFAVAGVLFLMLLLGTLESAYLYVAQNDLDNAAREAARGLQTNVTRAAVSGNPTRFGVISFCPELIVIPCSDITFTLNIVPGNYYSSLVTAPITPSGVTAGSSGDLMLLRATYPTNLTWPLNVSQLVGTAAYQNE